MRKVVYFLITIIVIGCSKENAKSPTDYVDVFIGTKSPGHTYLGATLPFGMAQLSPDTRNAHTSWPACAGYGYTDKCICKNLRAWEL